MPHREARVSKFWNRLRRKSVIKVVDCIKGKALQARIFYGKNLRVLQTEVCFGGEGGETSWIESVILKVELLMCLQDEQSEYENLFSNSCWRLRLAFLVDILENLIFYSSLQSGCNNSSNLIFKNWIFARLQLKKQQQTFDSFQSINRARGRFNMINSENFFELQVSFYLKQLCHYIPGYILYWIRF